MKTTYDWPEGDKKPDGYKPTADERAANLKATDPDQVRESVRAYVGTEIAGLIRDQFSLAVRESGITNVDRAFLRFPENEERFSDSDLTDKEGWDVPQIRMRRRLAMAQFFRGALFGTKPTDETIIRALSTTDAAGGFLIPPGWIGYLTKDVPKKSQLYQYVRRFPVASGTGSMPTVATNVSVFWGSEAVDFAEGDPTFGEATWTINRMNALVRLSREIASDANPDIVDVVTELFQEAIAEERDRVIAIGSGTGRPLGLYSASGITDVASITTLTYANMVNLHESVDARYFDSPSCRWLCNQNVKAAIMRIVDTQGQPIFVVDKSRGYAGTVFGHEMSIESSLPNNYIGFGDLKYYIWFDRQSMGMEKTTEGGDAFVKHQLFIKVWERADGKPVLPPTKPLARSRVVTGVTDLT